MEIAEHKLKSMLSAAAELGAMMALKKAGVSSSDEISQREAYRRYGESRVKRWLHQQKIRRVKSGDRNHKSTYSLTELETLYKTETL